MFPRGNGLSSNRSQQYVGVFLQRQGERNCNRPVEARVKFVFGPTNTTFSTHVHSVDGESVGTHRFIPRDSVLPKLVNGAFVVDVDLQIMLYEVTVVDPPSPPVFSTFMLQGSTEFSDVTFLVDGQEFHGPLR